MLNESDNYYSFMPTKIRRILFYLAIIWLIPYYGLSQAKGDHLEPVEDVFNLYEFQAEYYLNLRNLLFTQGFPPPEIRILSLPAFARERSIEVFWDNSENSGQIIKRVPEERIWQHAHPGNITVKEINRVIKRSDYNLLYELFLSAVNETSYQGARGRGLDGYTVYFMVREGRWKSGQSWYPKDGTKMNRLVDIYFELSKQLEKGKTELVISDSLSKQIETLKAQF